MHHDSPRAGSLQSESQQTRLAYTTLKHELKRNAEKRAGGTTKVSVKAELDDFFDAFSPHMTEEERHHLLYRFLSASKFVVSKAVASCMSTAEFRRQQHVGRMLLFPSLLPLCGYDEKELCTTLRLPYASAGTTAGSLLTAAMPSLEAHLRSSGGSECFSSRLDLSDAGTDPAGDGATDLSSFYKTDYYSLYVAGTTQDDAGMSHAPSASATTTGGDSAVRAGDVPTARRSSESGSGVGVRATPSFTACASLVSDTRSRPPAAAAKSEWWGRAASFFGKNDTPASSNALPPSSGPRVTAEGSVSAVVDRSDAGSGSRVVGTTAEPPRGGAAEDADARADESEALNYHPLLHPIISCILTYVPMSLHYWDKQGHPVLYCKLDALRSKKLTEQLFDFTPLGTQPVTLCLLFQIYLLEVMQQLIRWQCRRHERFNLIAASLGAQDDGVMAPKARVTSCVVVLDSANIHYHNFLHRPLFRMVRSVIALSQRHYPELLHQLYVVNCDKLVRVSYSLFRGVMKERTRSKVAFYSRAATPDLLRSLIADEYLPAEYGGCCNCRGGCIPRFDDEAADDTMSVSSSASSLPSRVSGREADSTSESPTTVLTRRSSHFRASGPRLEQTARKCVIAPRHKETMAFPVSAEEEIIWEFLVKKERKVLFSALFIPVNGDGAILTLFPKSAVCEDANHYVCPSDGTLILRWRNQRLIGHNAHVHIKVYRDKQN